MRKIFCALAIVLVLGSSAKACNPVVGGVAVASPAFGVGSAFTPFGVATPAFGFNAAVVNPFAFNAFATPFVANPFAFGGVNVAVGNVGIGRARVAVVGGRGRAVVRTRTVVRTR
jgi:hypothetical protein